MIDEKKLIEKIEFSIKASNTQHDNYMSGLRNGMRYCLALITRKEPGFEECKQWIPVSERLPKPQDLHEISLEDCTEYLIQRRYCVMNIAKYIKIYGKAFFCTHGFEVNDVIAWQPLPEPYQNDEQED